MWHADTTRNTIITVGNGGSEPTASQTLLYYNEGRSQYKIERVLAPGQQLWLNVGDLIHNQIPDSGGHTIPVDTTMGSYELRDLDHPLVGELFEGKLIVDKTYGHASYGCATCCGFYDVLLTPDPFAGPPDINNDDVIDATEQCGGEIDDVTGGGYDWRSTNASVATLPNRTLHTVAAGSARGSAEIQLEWTHPAPSCPTQTFNPQQPVCVGSLDFSGTANDFIFVGTDPNIVSANTYFLALASGTPSGGTYTGTSSNPSDTVTLTWEASLNLEKATIQTTVQSTQVGDRTLTFTYTPPSCTAALPLTQTVTARQFAYLTNPNPSNQCTLGHGTNYSITYTTYTHPDRNPINSESNLSNTPVTESFNPSPLPCGTDSGNTILDANGLFVDDVAQCSSKPLTCSATVSQYISVGGYQIRTNTLTFNSNGVSIVNDGPFQ